jgi:hypothetical protein
MSRSPTAGRTGPLPVIPANPGPNHAADCKSAPQPLTPRVDAAARQTKDEWPPRALDLDPALPLGERGARIASAAIPMFAEVPADPVAADRLRNELHDSVANAIGAVQVAAPVALVKAVAEASARLQTWAAYCERPHGELLGRELLAAQREELQSVLSGLLMAGQAPLSKLDRSDMNTLARLAKDLECEGAVDAIASELRRVAADYASMVRRVRTIGLESIDTKQLSHLSMLDDRAGLFGGDDVLGLGSEYGRRTAELAGQLGRLADQVLVEPPREWVGAIGRLHALVKMHIKSGLGGYSTLIQAKRDLVDALQLRLAPDSPLWDEMDAALLSELERAVTGFGVLRNVANLAKAEGERVAFGSAVAKVREAAAAAHANPVARAALVVTLSAAADHYGRYAGYCATHRLNMKQTAAGDRLAVERAVAPLLAPQAHVFQHFSQNQLDMLTHAGESMRLDGLCRAANTERARLLAALMAMDLLRERGVDAVDDDSLVSVVNTIERLAQPAAHRIRVRDNLLAELARRSDADGNGTLVRVRPGVQ